ncbi:MAG: hypothetical protein ABSF91_15040 [Bacteroidota bacterium]|jgi:hypothetical protein
MEITKPHNWGLDHFSEFIEISRRHLFESVSNLKPEYERLVAIDAVFKTVQENLSYSGQWLPALFFLRSHSSFLCASTASLSGQLAEAYMILRGCLENSLYALWFSKHKQDAPLWFRRNESPEAKKKVKNEFRLTKLLNHLKAIHPIEGNIATNLYERTIDFGAHPNQLSLTSTMRMSKMEDGAFVEIAYISGDRLANELCLKTTAQIGVCSLSIFGCVLEQRYKLLGIDQRIDDLKKGL